MRILTCAAVAAAVVLSACASTGGATDALNTAKKGLTAAHLAHDAAALGLSTAAKSGACRGSCAAQAKDYLDKSESYLKTADAAVAVGDAQTIESEVAAANAIIAHVESLAGKH